MYLLSHSRAAPHRLLRVRSRVGGGEHAAGGHAGGEPCGTANPALLSCTPISAGTDEYQEISDVLIKVKSSILTTRDTRLIRLRQATRLLEPRDLTKPDPQCGHWSRS